MNFLAVVMEKVIDVSANPSSTPPIQEQSHLELVTMGIEKSTELITRNLNDERTIDYYEIQLSGPNLNASIHPVSLKTTPRDPGPESEFAVIQANGQDVGSALVKV